MAVMMADLIRRPSDTRYWRMLRHKILNYGAKAGGCCILYADNHEFGMEHAPRGGQACCGIVLANEFTYLFVSTVHVKMYLYGIRDFL